MPEWEILGRPYGGGLLSSTTKNKKEVDPYRIASALKKVGDWSLGKLQRPSGLQFSFGLRQVPQFDDFLKDLKEATRLVKADPNSFNKMAPMYGLIAEMPDRAVVKEILYEYQD